MNCKLGGKLAFKYTGSLLKLELELLVGLVRKLDVAEERLLLGLFQ